MPTTIMSPQQQPEKEEASSENNGSSSSRISISADANSSDAGGVISDGEECEPAAAALVGHDYGQSSGGPLELQSNDTKPLNDAETNTQTKEEEELTTSTVAPEQQLQQQQDETEMTSDAPLVTAAAHVVEPNNDNEDEEEVVTDAQLFMQYQKSASSESLVQLNEETLKQPLLTEDDLGTGESVVKVKVASSVNEDNGQSMMKDGNEHEKIDNEEHEKATTETIIEEVSAEGESSIQSSQNSTSPTNQTTTAAATTFISPDRATMSMSPSLLMNNHHHTEKDEWSPPIPTIQQQQQHQQQHYLSPPLQHHQGNNNNTIMPNNNNNIISSPSRITYASPPGRRTIKLRLLEEIPSSLPPHNSSSSSSTPSSSLRNRKTPFKSFRKIRSLSLTGSLSFPYLNEDKSSSSSTTTTASNHENGTTATSSLNHNHDPNNNDTTMLLMDRGTITVSWYDGTTSAEMTEHVFGCVLRKLNQSAGNGGVKKKLEDVRLLDENVEPHEEVVLCPFLPDGSQFLLRFRTVEDKPERTISHHNNTSLHHHSRHPFASRAPDSPSAEPSPHPSNANLVSLNEGLHPQQLQVLNAAAAALLRPPPLNLNSVAASQRASTKSHGTPPPQVVPKDFSDVTTMESSTVPASTTTSTAAAAAATVNGANHHNITAEERTDVLIEQQLRQLNELFLQRRSGTGGAQFLKSTSEQTDLAEEEKYHREEQKQVIFLIGNYLVLFMSLIALSAEIQSRLPQMMQWVSENYDSVQNCATDRDALVDCLSKGDFSGLVASFLLWATQSVAAKRVFLFGFESPKKLWTVVYEALVTAVCWGISYLFIRRGLNPNTRQNFVHKYWKDAVYGSLAGFNAAFLKAVLKNLVPQDVALEALEGRQLKIFHWLGALLADE